MIRLLNIPIAKAIPIKIGSKNFKLGQNRFENKPLIEEMNPSYMPNSKAMVPPLIPGTKSLVPIPNPFNIFIHLKFCMNVSFQLNSIITEF